MALKFGNPQPCSSFQMSQELLQALAPLSEPISASRNDVLFRQGATCRGVYLVQSGLARISIVADSGQEIFRRLLGPGSVIGLPATLCSTPYTFSATCQTDCSFNFVAASLFLEFMRSQPTLGMEVVRLMGQELTEMNERCTNFHKCRECGCSFAEICEHEIGDSHL